MPKYAAQPRTYYPSLCSRQSIETLVYVAAVRFTEETTQSAPGLALWMSIRLTEQGPP